MPYSTFINETTMKLYNPATRIMVDFYPVKPAHGEPVSKEWFLKVVDFGGRTSKSFKNRVEMGIEVRERLDADYAVIDFNTEAEVANPMWGAC
jgi:hypothetical protein